MKFSHFLIVLILLLTSTAVKAATLVTTQSLSTLVIYPKQSAPATVVALNHSQIPAEISAKVANIAVRVGDPVSKGQALLSLACQDAQLAKDAEQTRLTLLSEQLAFDQREYERGEKLAQQNNIGVAELDRRKTQFQMAKANELAQKVQLERAQLDVERCSITAPFDGVVSKRMVSVGEMVNRGQALMSVIASAGLEVSAKVATQDVTAFVKAKHYQLQLGAQQFELELRNKVPLIEANTRSQEYRFNINATDVLAGSQGRLVWQAPQPHLPAHLLLSRNGQQGYFVMRAGKAEFIVVEGAEEGRPIPVAGLNDAEVIIEGRYGLTDGQSVFTSGQQAGVN